MIPILYSESTTTFDGLGLGLLADAISCNVVEERNGLFELTMTYPINGPRYKDIALSRIICAVPRAGATAQPFRVYRITSPIGGTITIYAQHNSYQMSDIPVSPFTASNVVECLQRLKLHAMETCPYTFWTDKNTEANYNQVYPESMRARLGGVAGSVLDVYGGEYEFDGYTVKLHGSRGRDNGVVLRYGKNIIDLEQEESIEDTITGIVPMWQDAEGGECVYANPVYCEYAGNYPHKKTRVIDFSGDFTDKPTAAQLTARAETYITTNQIGIPKVGIDVKFVALWDTEEYKDIAALERVNLCDTVRVIYDKLGIEVSAKVTKTDYNVLMDRYNEIYIGANTHSLSNTIANIANDAVVRTAVRKTALQEAIDNATALITGELGGYIVINKNAQGQPYEILVMDTDNIATATKVWRWNQSGLGYSSTGYDGEYALAMTRDGAIVADMIKTGTLEAGLVKILGTDRFYWDADNINVIDPDDPNKQIRIGRYDGLRYGIAFTQDAGDTWTTALTFDGLNVNFSSAYSTIRSNLQFWADVNRGRNYALMTSIGAVFVDGSVAGEGVSYWRLSDDLWKDSNAGERPIRVSFRYRLTGFTPDPTRSRTFRADLYYNYLDAEGISRAENWGYNISTAGSGTTGWVTWRNTIDLSLTGNQIIAILRVRIICDSGSTGKLEVDRVKVEISDTYTDYTIAPEDSDQYYTAEQTDVAIGVSKQGVLSQVASQYATLQGLESTNTVLQQTAAAITAEANRASEAEGTLSTRITTNAEGISAEVTRASNAEGALSTRITTNAEGISAEVTRAGNAEEALSTRITTNADGLSAEVTRAGNAEEALSTRITTNAEGISAEVTRAGNAEEALSTRITTNADGLSAEVTRASNAEGALSTSIKANTDSFTATFKKIGASGYTASGITTISETGIKVKHTSISDAYTEITASGFFVRQSNGTMLGGVFKPNGQNTVKAGFTSLFNPSYPNFSLQLDRRYDSGEEAYVNGLALYYKNQIRALIGCRDDENVKTSFIQDETGAGAALSDIISVTKNWMGYTPDQFINAGSSSKVVMIYAHGKVRITADSATYVNYSYYRFTEAPSVVAQYADDGSNTSGDIGALKIYNRTKDGFNAIIGGSTSQADRWIDWIAIGRGYGSDD